MFVICMSTKVPQSTPKHTQYISKRANLSPLADFRKRAFGAKKNLINRRSRIRMIGVRVSITRGGADERMNIIARASRDKSVLKGDWPFQT